MRRYGYLIIAVSMFGLLGSGTVMAQENKTGLTGANFLKIGVGARQVGLGSAATTISDDPHMMFWNPAGIVNMASDGGKTQVAMTHNQWLLEMQHNAFAFTRDLGSIGTLGIGVVHIGLGDIVADRDVAPTPALANQQADLATGATFNFYDLAVNVTLAHQFTERLSLGASVKFISEKIDDLTANAIAGDFGVIYDTGWQGLRLGARMSNLGSDLSFYDDAGTEPVPIPLIFSFGASFDIARQADSRLVALLDANKRQDSKQLYFGGMEWRLMEQFSLRGGYKFGFSNDKNKAGINSTDEGLSFGGGVNVPFGNARVQLDYAFTQFNLLDDTHRFSFSISF